MVYLSIVIIFAIISGISWTLFGMTNRAEWALSQSLCGVVAVILALVGCFTSLVQDHKLSGILLGIVLPVSATAAAAGMVGVYGDRKVFRLIKRISSPLKIMRRRRTHARSALPGSKF